MAIESGKREQPYMHLRKPFGLINMYFSFTPSKSVELSIRAGPDSICLLVLRQLLGLSQV